MILEKAVKWNLLIHSLPKFNLSLIGAFMWLTPPGLYRTNQRELTLDHIHTFLTTQGHGGPPRMRDQLNAGATSETTWTCKTICLHTIHTPIHSNKANMKRWLYGHMIFGDFVGLKIPDICLTGVEKPRKNLTQEIRPDRGSNPGLLRDRSVTCYTAVDLCPLEIFLMLPQLINIG